ncbi:hypothetical protein AAFX91_00260 [Bradyrhizobium sp. 31Argb]|uniref:hypothetical protein n=1 Tax=Bradyrhizobium sp. 31Argb TaxID=3141247 RepID=UPI00374A1B04
MLFATPESIERARRDLHKNYEAEYRAIPNRYRIAKSILEDGDLRKLAGADLSDSLAAKQLADELTKKHCGKSHVAASVAAGEAIIAQLDLVKQMLERAEELDRIERRSEAYRFAVNPPEAN